ncbi:MAG TPA: hypothetical protein VJQ57_10025, partial [Acidimicrobiia bacterium]|nr:hypothetical protein [Acidimicrobiia bacterium]
MTLLRYQRFSREHPCPICGGFDTEPRGEGRRCFGFLSSDGDFAHCTREERAGRLPLNADSSTYPHILSGDCACGVRHLVRRQPSKAKKTKGRIVATYDYNDAVGNLLFQVVRYEPKGFKCRQPNRLLTKANRNDAPFSGDMINFPRPGFRRITSRLVLLIRSSCGRLVL